MLKTKISRGALVLLSSLILVGVVIMSIFLFTAKGERVIEVKLEPYDIYHLSFERMALAPGEECSYPVKISMDGIDDFDVSLEFKENAKNTLSSFVFVKVVSSGDTVCEGRLSEIMESGEIILTSEQINDGFELVYYMPESTGNDAQGKETEFELLITPIIN